MMTDKKTAPGANRPASRNAFCARHFTANDLVEGWFCHASNGKPSRNYLAKRGWGRGGEQ